MPDTLRTGFDHTFRRQEGVDRSSAALFRHEVRTKKHTGQTSGCAPGFLQANFVAVPKEFAFDFMLFCLRNPQPCPLLEVINEGSTEPIGLAPGSDITTDIPRCDIPNHSNHLKCLVACHILLATFGDIHQTRFQAFSFR